MISVLVRGTAAPLDKGVFHLVMEFPENYPSQPPIVYLCTPLPHANIFKDNNKKRNSNNNDYHRICLDMLEDGEFAGKKGHEFSGWTSSYR